jgi:hypothetical protein
MDDLFEGKKANFRHFPPEIGEGCIGVILGLWDVEVDTTFGLAWLFFPSLYRQIGRKVEGRFWDKKNKVWGRCRIDWCSRYLMGVLWW